MSFIDEIFQGFWVQIFWITVGIIITAVLAYFRMQLLVSYRHIRALLLNVPARINATYVSKYQDAPTAWLSKEVFDVVSARVRADTLRKLSSSEKSIGVFSDKLGMPLTIWLEEEPDLSDQSSVKPLSYKITIQLDAELRIGIRSIPDFQAFVTLATVSEQTIREKCFPGNGPYQQFILCDVRRDGQISFPRVGDREDPNLAAKVSVHDSQVNLVCREPTLAVDALKKYFPW